LFVMPAYESQSADELKLTDYQSGKLEDDEMITIEGDDECDSNNWLMNTQLQTTFKNTLSADEGHIVAYYVNVTATEYTARKKVTFSSRQGGMIPLKIVAPIRGETAAKSPSARVTRRFRRRK
jgi:hypothetical protein